MPPSPSPAAERLADISEFIQAVADQDWDRADALWNGISGTGHTSAWAAAAALHMARERWEAATEAWNLSPRTPDTLLRQTLCRNLAALKLHRPQVYRLVLDADVGTAYRIDAVTGGQQTIAAQRPDGGYTPFSSNPAATIGRAMQQLQPAMQRGDTIALLSIGDGHMLKAAVAGEARLFLGRRQALMLIEPDPRLLLATLLIHDFSGPDGPIVQERIYWYVGPQWSESLRLDVATTRFHPLPKLNIRCGLDGQPMEDAITRIIAELGQMDTRSMHAVKAHYEALPPDAVSRALAGQAGRPARILLLTTRFSTVLQHSTRDVADALRQLGCEPLLVIEPSLHQPLTRLGLRQMVADFKPDLVLQIDHNRFEHPDLFPPNLPFVNWIQDLLPHLMTPAAGQKLGTTDFALTPSLQRWIEDYAYPPRQCMEFRKLTRVPERPMSWASDDNRVIYVSNWSQTPEQVRQELLENATDATRDLLDRACRKMMDLYTTGHTLYTPGDCRGVLLAAAADAGVLCSDKTCAELAIRLFDRLNNLLYRQQGLCWAQEACDALGLSLEIYGGGWADSERFGRSARGPVSYGEPLESLTRAAGVTLVLEPFVCVSHQRLLDALTAGGFCLLRGHPSNELIEQMLHWVSRAGATVTSAAELQTALVDPADREGLRQTLEACVAIEADPRRTDFIAGVRRQQEAGFLPATGPLLPRLEQTTFHTAEQLRLRLQRFVTDAPLRAEIARAQRRAVEARYSYTTGMQRMLAFVSERLSASPAARAEAA